VNAQKPWAVIEKELGVYRDVFVDKNGFAPPGPLLVTHTVVDKSEARARELFEEHVLGYMKSALVHYEFANKDLASVPGYEYYGRMADAIAAEGTEPSVRMLADLQIWGTPEQVVERMTEDVRRLDGAGVIVALSFGAMDDAEARRNQELFARTVLPRLRTIDTHREIPGPLELVN
jgi:alkanesulfonate monooxygenase SsuD/methylene tetrahydromethanopterin reductase-like flavin-dependent oxidoreductase (luciferase family)